MNIWICKKQEMVCASCKHFWQHYVFDGDAFRKCNAGHCVYPRLKNREPADGCEYFAPKPGPVFQEERRDNRDEEKEHASHV